MSRNNKTNITANAYEGMAEEDLRSTITTATTASDWTTVKDVGDELARRAKASAKAATITATPLHEIDYVHVNTIAVLLHLADHEGARLSSQAIATELQVVQRTVQRALSTLETLGLIAVDRTRKPSSYAVTYGELAALRTAMAAIVEANANIATAKADHEKATSK